MIPFTVIYNIVLGVGIWAFASIFAPDQAGLVVAVFYAGNFLGYAEGRLHSY